MLAVFSLSLFLSTNAHAAYQVKLDAPRHIKKLLTDFLDLIRYQKRTDLNEDQLNFMIATVGEQVTKLTSTQGYFSPKTSVRIDRSQKLPIIYLKVDAGPQTTISNVRLQVAGVADEASPAQVEQLRQTWSLPVGEPFRQEAWTSAKDSSLAILQRHRYAAARITDSQATIHPEASTADLSVAYDSGPIFTLGQVNITGTRRYPESIIRNVNPLRVGEEYSVDRLLEFQHTIQRTPYFSNVVIDVPKDTAKSELAPVNVKVTEFPTQQIRGGTGYETDTGARVEGRYSYYNMFDRAWVFDTQARLEQRRQTGSLQLSTPPDTTGFVNNVHASVDRTTLEGVDLRSRRIGLGRTRSTDQLDRAYTLEYYNDSLQQINGAPLPSDTIVLPGTHRALVAGFSQTYRRLDSLTFPRRGYIASIELGAAAKNILTDQTFFRTYGKLQTFYPVAKRDIVVLRGELGAVISKGGNAEIPASLLFRAGGSNSVRGYAYQSIGNEQNGTVFPTRFLVTGSTEYQHWFSQSWGAAVFYDVGAATDNWPDKTFFHGVGVGARWRSPVGSINVDLAYGIDKHSIRPDFSFGVAF